jgi:hypothetical protein
VSRVLAAMDVVPIGPERGRIRSPKEGPKGKTDNPRSFRQVLFIEFAYHRAAFFRTSVPAGIMI